MTSETENNSQVQAMVLAAGFGTRLWPLTGRLAKPAVPFLGKALVAHCVDLLELHGIKDIVVNTHYQAQSVERALKDRDVRFSHETEILGTAGALRHAIDQGLLNPERPTLIINGKLFTDIDLSAAINHHRTSNAEITMVLRENSNREAFREIICEDSIVRGFGKTREPEGPHPLLFTGIHILSSKALKTIPSGNSDTIRDTYPPFLARGEVQAVRDRSPYWWEFSTIQRYMDLHVRAYQEGLAPLNSIAQNTQISPSSTLKNCVIWAQARIDEDCELDHVVIGEGVHLAPNTRISHMIVIKKSFVETIERGEVQGDYVFVPLA